MKKLLLIITLLLTVALGASAQGLEFAGIPINDTSAEAFESSLIRKHYTFETRRGWSNFYKGRHKAAIATVMVTPTADGKIRRITVTLEHSDPETIIDALIAVGQELDERYSNYEYVIQASPNGDMKTIYYRAKSGGLYDSVAFDMTSVDYDLVGRLTFLPDNSSKGY